MWAQIRPPLHTYLFAKDYNWLETIYCVVRSYHWTKNYTGLSPNELVFGREKMGPGLVMYHPRQCYDASQCFQKI